VIQGIHHTAISSPDVARLARFYCEIVGFAPASEFHWPRGWAPADAVTALTDSEAKGQMLRLGNSFLELFEYASPLPQPADAGRRVCDHGITHICLAVTDLDAEYERLHAAGMTFHAPPQDMGPDLRATYGRDPDGNVIELIETDRPAFRLPPTAL
jgi:catechol 2,3-dioxygenase-like lactoylglutathione lyase family enzyme